MKWLTRSVVPSMVALAALVSFLPRTGPTIKIVARDYKFVPSSRTVAVGTTIRFINTGKNTHTFTCPGCGASTADLQPDQEATLKFVKEGSFEFYCRYHREAGMIGRITVGHPTPAPSPTASPSPTG